MGQVVNKELLDSIALKIKKLRADKKITQEVFLNDTGINIARIEKSKRNISISTLEVICNYLEISLCDFFKENEDLQNQDLK